MTNEADRVIRFIEKHCTHVKGELGGQPIQLEEWQKNDIIIPTFGTLRADGLRQYRTVYVEIPRKNAKSTLCAAIAIYLLLADGEHGAEIYSAGGDRGQAGIVFDIAKQMILQNKELSSRSKPYRNSIIRKKSNNFYKPISADADTKHGFNAHGIIFDELHTQPDRELWDVLTTSVGSRRQPLIFAITTAGFDKNSICWEIHTYAEKVRDGIIEDKTFLPVIYKADEEDDIFSVDTWKKANPGFGSIVKEDYILAEVNKIKNNPSMENTFRRLHLNQWTSSETRWISDEDWAKGDGELPDLTGALCYGGLDLASTRDTNALVLYFPEHECVKAWFWIPELTAKERTKKDGVNYGQWINEGWINETSGNVVDYAFLERDIYKLCDTYDIHSIAYDRWGATQLILNLRENGVDMQEFGQGFASMSAPTKQLEKMILSGEINHGGNPVLRWMCSNIMIEEDAAGNIKISKKKSTEKVDGMVSMVMALGEKMTNTDTSNTSENPITNL